MLTHRKNIFIGMSGGVDSSVAALLLKEAGHQVTGIFMKNWEEEGPGSSCPASLDMADAQAVCDQLQIELRQINFADEYWERVFTLFLNEYRAGRTPNPDILCNTEIKFKAFLKYAKQYGADFIATGHYARCINSKLLKAKDSNKDQSYFLHGLTEDQLAHSLFPLGEIEKIEVRKIAKKAGFKNHAKKDSTGICFIGERKFKNFLNEFLPSNPGSIITTEGDTVGEHDGLMFYTIGQRQGLKIGGKKNALEAPWYVVEKNLKANTLIVTQSQESPLLYRSHLLTEKIHWINEPPALPFAAQAKIRYRQADQACVIYPHEQNKFKIEFSCPQRAVTPGQSVVLYQGDICLGGGIII